MTILKIMCGCPGSGKSHYIKNYAEPEDLIVSRDEIRFAMLSPGIPYFSKEKEVFDEYCNRINSGIDNFPVIWADATHLNTQSRQKLFYAIDYSKFEKIIFICIETPLAKCIKQNAQREGLERVPENALRKMYHSYTRPSAKLYSNLNVEIKVIKNE